MHRSVAGMLALGLLGAPASGWSAEPASELPRQQLGEHLFIVRELVVNPFTASYLSSDTSVAYGTANGPTFDLAGNRVNIEDYSIGFFTQHLGGQWGVADWWALRASMQGTIFGGVNSAALAGVGVSGVVRLGVGTTFSFPLAENLRLGAVVDVVFGPSLAINLLESIRQSINTGSVQTPVTSSYGTAVTPTLSLAWTLARGFGAIVNASYLNGVVSVNDTSTVDGDLVVFQGALDMNLRELGALPLGIAASYSAGYSTGARRFRRYLLDLGFYYTGKPGLTAGVDLAYRRAPVEEVYVKSFSVIFTLAYAFN